MKVKGSQNLTVFPQEFLPGLSPNHRPWHPYEQPAWVWNFLPQKDLDHFTALKYNDDMNQTQCLSPGSKTYL